MFPAVSPKKTSERKKELHKEAQAYKKTIDGQVNDLKTEAARIGTTALIVGTALAGVYVLFSLLTSDSKEEKKIKKVENSNLPVVVKKDKSGDSTDCLTAAIISGETGFKAPEITCCPIKNSGFLPEINDNNNIASA